MQKIEISQIEEKTTQQEFDWDSYGADCPSVVRKHNPIVSAKYPGAKVYSREKYALEDYEKYMNIDVHIKDFNNGDVVRVSDIKVVDDNRMLFELANGFTLVYDMTKERKFCNIYGIPVGNCKSLTHDCINTLVELDIYVELCNKGGNVHGNLYNGHVVKANNEFKKQIDSPTSAYVANVLSRNKGGFIVEVMGVEAFLPGSLASANKIIDFDEYIGKEIPVMIEGYLGNSETFIVSNKKYIQYVLPSKIKEINVGDKYSGNVTDTTNFGIFLEFMKDDFMYTGLLHNSKMLPDTKNRFKSGGYKPGDDFEFYVTEITKDNMIILGEEDPQEKLAEIERFKKEKLGHVVRGNVVSTKHYGALVNLEKDITGLVSSRELRNKDRILKYGDEIYVLVNDIEGEKIYLNLVDETEI